jgi:quinol-cytochrome oxidoreductase complex cytochrome b subunit
MNEKEKKEYLEKYQKAKNEGVPFFPDILFKDAVVALLVFLILVGLAYFLGAPLENRANPADTSYTPRPEWYFIFLFQLLKYFPGNLEVIGVIIIPSIVIALLF